ncbi:hypothetical protein MtrunA17_Chr5g0427991 [Medicago truncatula]|uniref:Transmembrane protein n=1 Tax=Medicago truncatula TaxID=3880 RepID=A0A396HSH4_MEDTR|nr:hypothetical protein MtrunA17_Chr5g0427991 [Medicago truncatula]
MIITSRIFLLNLSVTTIIVDILTVSLASSRTNSSFVTSLVKMICISNFRVSV